MTYNLLENKSVPRYSAHIFICENQRVSNHIIGCCASKGSKELIHYMKEKIKELNIKGVRINKSGCLGQCSNGPAMVLYPSGKWFKITNKEDIDIFITKFILLKQ